LFKQGISDSALTALGVIAATQFGKQFYLAGGTAAAIQLGHRLSVDLDFFCLEEFDGSELARQLEQKQIRLGKLKPSFGALHCVIEETKISFLQYQYPLLRDTIEYKGAQLASLLDIALMKITAIASRGARKDFIDLHFILKNLSLQEVLDHFPEKFPIEKIDPYHYIKSLTYFEDAENDPMPIMLSSCNWSKVKKSIQTAVKCITLG